jgi:hypothetical protein
MGNFILYALSASTQLIFCILIFYASKTDANEAKKRLRTQFYLLAVAIIAWCAGQYAYEISNNLRYQEIVSRFGIIATVWVAFFFALFARRIIGSKDRLLLRIELLLAILATMTGLFLDIVHTSLEARTASATGSFERNTPVA